MKKVSPIIALYLLAALLLVPALLINLGLMTFIDDESIRSLVALEMKLSGNFITPTLHGAFYYNKPPLFNWILLVFFNLAGKFDEFTARIPTVIALLGYALTVFYFFRRQYDTITGLAAAFILITCGRILFWDSMLALIDITFSWVVFSLFMVVFYCFQQEKWNKLFLLSYLLAAVGFMLKGLPAIVFQGLTLLAWFTWRGQFRRLFSWVHVAGGMLFLVLVGSYYWIYQQHNGLDVAFQTLFTESSKRTVVRFGWGHTILHIFTFPFEMVYHFLPWSLMVVYLLDRKMLDWLRQDRFMEFAAITFLVNIVLYWTSPEVYPRYLLMLAPLIFGIFLRLHTWHEERRTLAFRVLDAVFLGLIILIALGSWLPLFLEQTQSVPNRAIKTLAVAIPAGILAIAAVRKPAWRMPLTVLVLLLFRITFDWFVLPDRNANDFGRLCRISSQEAGREFLDRDLYVYRNTDMQPTNSFYLTNSRGAIIPRKWKNFDKKALYIIDFKDYPKVPCTIVSKIDVRHGKRTFYIVELK